MPKRKRVIDIPTLVGFTKLAKENREHANDMIIVRFANSIGVAQYRGRVAAKNGKKPTIELKFWIYATQEGVQVDRSLISVFTLRIDALARRFGEKVIWDKGELQVAEHDGKNYLVKGGKVRDVYAFIPHEDSRVDGLYSEYKKAFNRLKKAGISLKGARLHFDK
jgi:hypothetical protein